ncbi:branched-chain amino acid ABC transporter substrate-binding protein [Kitasatospora sp. MMS16-BH015]|uniref:branched-chain amino acid ABC transporter substrate-binding protein n=1 Tax=Kitasatospora sp. MMS16-BH015 TaxID=2018025 RepID=UPI000CA1CAEA|nr:branched-chain amino acid ABC transporter substrate-binding protein [Kitasatospora sp. MMS16-BH015]AUG76604.1 branched-chain amino acid ABC transporter substrate-binding protein [Kitasatospora sp. MMS16-BH015]
MRNRATLVVSIAVIGALSLTACGSRGGSKTSGGDSAGGTTTVTIGVDAPLTGDLSALGLGIKNSVDLAINQANANNEVPGVKFKIQALDDTAKPAPGQQNATQLVADKSVLGVVGPLNSSVAQSMQQIFNDAHLTEISPANTGVALTQGEAWASGKKVRPFASYFRTATTDAVQGPFAAQYLVNTAAKKKVFLIDDQKTYGAGLAATFKGEYTKLGGTIVGEEHVNPDDRDFSAIVTKVKASGADAVYYGGEYPAAGPLSLQLKDAGANIPLMGGDGIQSGDFIKLNAKSQGDLATAVGLPVESLPSAAKFIADYKAAAYKDAYETYGGYSYDSARAIILGVKAVVQANNGKLPSDARAKVVEAVQAVSFDGVTGKVSFDEYGDTTNKQLTVYKVDGGKWAVEKSGTFVAS